MDRTQHTVTKFLNDEKTHGAIHNKKFKSLGFLGEQLYEAEIVKSEVEHKKPITFGLFILQYLKVKILELSFNFFHKLCDDSKFEELQMDTELLFLALFEHNLYDRIHPAMKKRWKPL